jgi:hypothetical protein
MKMDLSFVPNTRPNRTLRLLLVHHSVGGALFATPDAESAVASCIWERQLILSLARPT